LRASTRGLRWTQIADFDERVRGYQQQRGELQAEAAMLQAQLPEAEQGDASALADWHANGQQGNRPEPIAATIQTQLEQLDADTRALDVLVDRTLADKAAYAQKHRSKLVHEAHADVEQAHQRMYSLVGELEHARAGLVEAA
jgi:hypothetical protein